MANRGMPAALIRPTAMPTPHEANGETSIELLEDPVDGDGQGRGEANGSARRSPKRRPRASAAGDKGKGRKLTLPDSVFDRLVLTAIKAGPPPRRSPRRSSTATCRGSASRPTTDSWARPTARPGRAGRRPG